MIILLGYLKQTTCLSSISLLISNFNVVGHAHAAATYASRFVTVYVAGLWSQGIVAALDFGRF